MGASFPMPAGKNFVVGEDATLEDIAARHFPGRCVSSASCAGSSKRTRSIFAGAKNLRHQS